MAAIFCSTCSCELIGCGVVFASTSTAVHAFCSKRCESKGRRGVRAKHAARRTATAEGVPIEPEIGWGSLSQDVLTYLAANHLDLRARVVGSMVCSHWRTALTEGARHVEFRSDDASCWDARREGAFERTLRVLDSARKVLPEVHSLRMVGYHKCLDEAALLRSVQAVTRWTQLQQLRISWDESPIDDSTLVAEYLERTGRDPQQAATMPVHAYLPTGPRPQPSEFDQLCMGALGRLTALRSLALTGVPLASYAALGLYGLSTLERLTSLELLNGRGSSNSWARDPHPNDTDLCCLTSLRRLSISGELLSPAVMTALAQLSGLTQLQLDLFRPEEAVEVLTPERLSKLQQLRSLHMSVGYIGSSGQHAASTEVATSMLVSLKALASAVRERHEQQQQEQQQARAPAQQQPQQLRGAAAARVAAPGRQQQSASKTVAGAHGLTGTNQRRKQRASDRACSGRRRGCQAAAAPLDHMQHTTAMASEYSSVDDDGDADQGDGLPLRVYLDLSPEDSPHCLQLTSGLMDALCDLGGALRHLDAGFGAGAAANMYRLTELTALTSLSLRCLPGTQPDLAAWDLQRLGVACSCLHSLRLALPPERMEAVVPGLACGGAASAAGGSSVSAVANAARAAGACAGVTGSGGFGRLAVLELQAYVHTKEVVVPWPDLQPRLAELLAAQLREQLGGDSPPRTCQHTSLIGASEAAQGACVDAPGDASGSTQPGGRQVLQQQPPPLVPLSWQQRAVAAARGPLSSLAQLIHALPTLEEVEQALLAEEDWRDRRRGTRRRALVEQGMDEAAAAESAQREAAAATPTVPVWVLQYLSPEKALEKTMLTGGEVGGDGPTWLFGPDGGAAGAAEHVEVEAAALQRARAELACACQPVAMHLLRVRQLQALREVLLCEQLVAGPVFRLHMWTPRNLQALRLEGFIGLSFRRANGGTSSGGCSLGPTACPGAGVDWAPATLRDVDVVLHGGPAEEEAALAGLRLWQQVAAGRADGGAALSVQSRCQLWAELVR